MGFKETRVSPWEYTWNGYNDYNTYSFNTYSYNTTNPFPVFPVSLPEHEPVKETTVFDWLRRRVEEITDLAWA